MADLKKVEKKHRDIWQQLANDYARDAIISDFKGVGCLFMFRWADARVWFALAKDDREQRNRLWADLFKTTDM